MRHFKLSEFVHDGEFPDFDEARALYDLVENVLLPLRDWFRKPIHINSGYRSPDHNKAIGGVPTSSHIKGEAADIDAGSKDENKKLFGYIVKNLAFDQCICEKDYEWIHVSYKDGENRRQVLYL
jgi:zinc D-Ala-D-Ala carboxypeptidase